MPAMGRRRSTHHGLPPHMARKGDAYYYVTNPPQRRWLPLGSDYPLALAAWAKHEGGPVPETARTFTQIAAWYEVEILPGKALRTQDDNRAELVKLRSVFGDSPIETITPVDVRTYLNARMSTKKLKEGEKPKPARTRANREVSLLSHVINYAREKGFTEMANPCAGITKHGEVGRGRYLDDDEFDAIYAEGDMLLQDAMDLLSSTTQRPGDVIKMKRTDIRDSILWGKQGKTGTRQRFDLEGDLKEAVERMKERPRKATGVYLIQDDDGQPLNYWMLEGRWAKARAAAAEKMPSVADAQMRDIRGKVATDVDDLARAQLLLGHKTRAMTERYVKQRAGYRVKPHTRRKKGTA